MIYASSWMDGLYLNGGYGELLHKDICHGRLSHVFWFGL